MLVGELPNLYCNHIVCISEAMLVYLTLNMLLSEVDCFVSIDGTFRSIVEGEVVNYYNLAAS